ncbi:MAG: TetR/AcrR family transcriptional regulator [Clostridiaceae bacterium]|nr:TetR/AcrR family transcriptional regulator [Clostridiaceae bacterium]
MERKIYHKSTFEKTSRDRQIKVYWAAISVFSQKGYEAASVQDIAQKAGISVGSLYSYFSSKEDLFKAIAEMGYAIFEQIVTEWNPQKEDSFRSAMTTLFRMTLEYSRKYPELSKLYLLLTTDSLSPFSDKLSKQMESSFRSAYAQLLKNAQEKGELRPDIDLEMAGYFLDNTAVMLQFAQTTKYYQGRLRQYLALSDDEEMPDDRIVDALVNYVCTGLTHDKK